MKLKETKKIKIHSIFLIFLLLICMGCNQQLNEKKTIQNQKSSKETKMGVTAKIVPNSLSLPIREVKLLVTNNTSLMFYTGFGYYIQRYNGSSWQKLPINICTEKPLLILAPNKTREINIYLYPEQYTYIPGKYRICKTGSTIPPSNQHPTRKITGKIGRNYKLTAEFNLK